MRKIIVFCVCLFMTGCCLRSPDSNFYVMNSDNLSPLSSKKLNITVSKVVASDMLDRPQMVVYDKGSDRVQIMEFNRWPEVLPDVVQGTITNDLIAYLPNSYVKRSYFDGSGSTVYSINVELNRFEAYLGDKVILSAWWNIQNSSGVVVKKQQSRYELKVTGTEIQDLVNAQTLAVHELSKDIALGLINL